MTGFSAEWLRLREPFDHAAREGAAAVLNLPGTLARWRAEAPAGSVPTVLDLASGHGANLRELAPRLGGAQRWRLVDHDAGLLAAVPDSLAEWARRHRYHFAAEEGAGDDTTLHISGAAFSAAVRRERLDLARDLPALDVRPGTLITASALLDLVSQSWLQRLIGQARDARAAMLFVLSVDGRTTWEPNEAGDEAVRHLFEQHQRRDKGFGLALGPMAPARAMQMLADAGYRALQAPSDWVIDGADGAAMQRAIIEGMASAALEQDPAARQTVQAWQARRGARMAGTSLRIGHMDIVATPPPQVGSY